MRKYEVFQRVEVTKEEYIQRKLDYIQMLEKDKAVALVNYNKKIAKIVKEQEKVSKIVDKLRSGEL